MTIRSLTSSRTALATGLVLSLATAANAQSNWVDFSDATATRLVTTTVNSATDDEEKDLSAADFDNDGDTDLIVVRKTPFTFAGPRTNVLLMNENGVLTERTAQYCSEFSIPDDTRDLAVFDANNDGWLDFVTATTFFEQPRLFMNLGNDGMGNWQGFLSTPNWMTAPFSPAPKFCSVIAGDVDNDGFDDLFFSDYENSLGDRLVINNRNGTFTDESPTRLLTGLFDSTFGTQGHIEDLNGDGWADIMNTSGSSDPPDINYNDQTGKFSDGTTLNLFAAYQSNVADLDNDNDLDIYICDDGQDYMFYNEGTPIPGGHVTWSSAVGVFNSFLTQGFNHHNHFADIDRDGFLDIGQADVDVDISGCTGQFALLRNELAIGNPRGYSDPNNFNHQPWNSFGTYDFAWIDINGDGCLDMVHGLCTGYKVFIQTACDVVGDGPGIDACNGDGGNQMGCTNCPCMNNATPGTTGGCLNSSGNSGELVDSGVPSVSGDSLRFEATGLPAGAFSILTSGDGLAPTNAANPCFGMDSGAQAMQFDGLRCAVVNTRRHGGRPADANGDVGVTNNGWGPPSGPPIGLVAQGGYAAGQTRNYQLIYREDPLLSCMRALNTSQGVSMTFLP